ncbi:adenylate kinase 3, putative [Schistosoma mansoni]|uniref:Adenylate kinase 3, putative n=1 Tax=Schistosoma mansoni TaxID=6183 RepID=G4M079_SCHMA|nr:adenylate kinase 3, putative [Schistosoma mansoni]|eukprot:XP_018646897.1 adenylate kinase 3, putative [Schistosoma mansoni]
MRFSQAFTSNVRAVIIGPPGSGKATISLRLQKDFALKYICCGDMLRNHVVLKTDIGDQVSRFIQNGSLVPDSLVTKMMIAECQSYTGDNLLIDGFPRTMIQAKDIQRQLPITCVLCLDVPFEEIINRISGRYTHLPSGRTYNDKFNPPKRKGFDDVTGEPLIRRDDDDPITVRKRLDVYQLSTLPLLDYYGKQKILHVFHGCRTNELWPQVFKIFSQFVKPIQYTEYDTN